MRACAAGQYPGKSCTLGRAYPTPSAFSLSVSAVISSVSVARGRPGAIMGSMLNDAAEPKARMVAPWSMSEGAQAW